MITIKEMIALPDDEWVRVREAYFTCVREHLRYRNLQKGQSCSKCPRDYGTFPSL